MNNKTTQLKLCLYNRKTIVDYIIELLKQLSILFIVEHWLSDDKLANVSTHFPGYSVYGVSALGTLVLLQNRPHGGCLVIFTDRLGGGAKYNKTVSKRLCALSIIFNDIIIFLYIYAEHICIVGDMHTDISRSHSRHIRLLLQFVENEQLYLSLNLSDKNAKYTYYNNYHQMHSIIDHFILSQCLFDLIISYHSIVKTWITCQITHHYVYVCI